MRSACLVAILSLSIVVSLHAQRTQKPVLHAKHWMAITGKPLAATAGARIFHKEGNAIDAACAMLAATSTMWDVLGWGGETQALIYNPNTQQVIGINALGVAPTGATAAFYKEKGLQYPPERGPLSAVTPGTPGGLMTMLAEFGTMSLGEVLAPAMEMAEGYPMELQTAQRIEANKQYIKEWPYSRDVFLPNLGEDWESPHAGEIFVQTDLLNTLQKLVDTEAAALKAGKTRKQAIYAAYDRFYKGDIAEELVRATQEQGGLITMEDLANWQVYIEEPDQTNYKGIDVYKLTSWVQGPVMLQALNMVEQMNFDRFAYNSARYMHMLYQVMNMCFADRDFYYGDPYFPPEEPMNGLLSKEYAKERLKEINWEKNALDVKPGDPYPFEGEGLENPYKKYISSWYEGDMTSIEPGPHTPDAEFSSEAFYMGTTSIQTADEEGWVVSVTPSGAWVPAVIAGKTGVGLSQRAQSFVLYEEENPFNVIEPGKRPRATLTPGMALKDGKPYLSFAVQGGDAQDQNLLQFFLNMVEFDMNVQEATEAANINSFQMRGSFSDHPYSPGEMLIHQATPFWTRRELREMGYRLRESERTSGPINAIFFDWEKGSMWGGSSNHGEDYGIGW
ncbi:MAG: gamma-glutamyltransferase [Bacteroidota bacterium]